MVTAIVRRVQAMLAEAGRSDIGVEIVFPVSREAVTTDKQTTSANGASNGASNAANGAAGRSVVEFPPGLSIVPGPASGEGCSMEGGCASCPYMKMNSLRCDTQCYGHAAAVRLIACLHVLVLVCIICFVSAPMWICATLSHVHCCAVR